MTSLSPPCLPSKNHEKLKFPSNPNRRCSNSRWFINPSVSRCRSSGGNFGGWDMKIQDMVKGAIKRVNEFISRKEERESVKEECEWEWWLKHFNEVDQQQAILYILKSQLADAVKREEYGDASRLKVAIAAAATNDAVGRVMSQLNKAIEEERYQDAAFLRDFAGAGLVGWWSGISEGTQPHGVIIRISAEHGRYLARSYSPHQLAAATAGLPLFEIFLTINNSGEYKQQAVYLKQTRAPREFPTISSNSIPYTGMTPLESTEKTDLLSGTEDTGDGEDEDDDSDISETVSGFDNILRDMIPVVKVKVMKVTAPGKVDRDLLSKIVEQTIEEEEDEEKVNELESADKDSEEVGESDNGQNGINIDAGGVFLNEEGQNEIAVKVVVGDIVQNLSDTQPEKHVTRVPARLENKGRLSFSFSIKNDDNPEVTSNGKGKTLRNKKPKILDQRSMDSVISELAKSIGRGRLPTEVYKNISELISLSINQSLNLQVLSGSTTFTRIEIPSSPDPLNGLYMGTHGLYGSEIIQLRRKFGHWRADGGTKDQPNLEFYEYVEAVKLTGDRHVPAGQVAFRAKVGKRYELPHKGIIPEEFGVKARYKGQGKLAEKGYKKPRWVDGELVVLDGKNIKGGPVVGFVYWAPEYQFLVFFNRLRLQQ